MFCNDPECRDDTIVSDVIHVELHHQIPFGCILLHGDSRRASYLVQFVEPRRFDTITFSGKPFLSKTGYIYFADVGRRVDEVRVQVGCLREGRR